MSLTKIAGCFPLEFPLSDRQAVWPQYLFPKGALTRFAGWVANARWGGITHTIIRRFVRKYQVNMAEAAQPDITGDRKSVV